MEAIPVKQEGRRNSSLGPDVDAPPVFIDMFNFCGAAEIGREKTAAIHLPLDCTGSK